MNGHYDTYRTYSSCSMISSIKWSAFPTDLASVCLGIMKCYVEHRSAARFMSPTVCSRQKASVSNLINQTLPLLAWVFKAYCWLTFSQAALY